jgi:hypothetical protein
MNVLAWHSSTDSKTGAAAEILVRTNLTLLALDLKVKQIKFENSGAKEKAVYVAAVGETSTIQSLDFM